VTRFQFDPPDQVDLVVVGGGITGAGVARDAAMRGLRVLLVEMNDLASATSSRSSKLVHGGLRYLEQYEFGLVFESVSERRILMQIAPHLVRPLGFVFPVYQGAARPLWMIRAGMWLYDGLSLFRSPKTHRPTSSEELSEAEPLLTQEDLRGAPLYYDCATDDARLTLETALDARQNGAVLWTHAKVVGFEKTDGRISGVRIADQLNGTEHTVSCSVVVNATGPWTDDSLKMDGVAGSRVLRPTKGVHIVVPQSRLPLRYAVVMSHPTDERVLFAIPWGEASYIGTTDTDYHGDPAEVAATSSDVDYLLDASAAYFPEAKLTRDDVLATWAGLRPLIAPPSEDGSESSVSREHKILVRDDGLVTIAGGKLTTYRKMAAEVVDAAVEQMPQNPSILAEAATADVPLPGAVGWPEGDSEAIVDQIHSLAGDKIDNASAVLLAHTYGVTGLDVAARVVATPELAARIVEGRPEILAQVDHAVERELASTLSDVLIRRTQLFFRTRDQGLSAVGVVADRMSGLLGWSEEQRSQMEAEFRHQVDLATEWMQSHERDARRGAN